MSQCGHFRRQERFVSFRFEESLRKYEPPPRKLHKRDHHNCSHCSRKSIEVDKESRLSRLCETRKKYHITSREQASEFSKKKESLLESAQPKILRSVSNFDCSDSVLSNHRSPQQSHHSPQQSRRSPQESFRKDSKPESATKPFTLCWEKNPETPIKQQVRRSLLQQADSVNRQMEQQKLVQHNRTKDIEFHIGMVEELQEQFIRQYRLQTTPTNSSEQIGGIVDEFWDNNEVPIAPKADICEQFVKDVELDGVSQMVEQEAHESVLFLKEFQLFNLEQLSNGELAQQNPNIQIPTIQENTHANKSRNNNKRRSIREVRMLEQCEVSVNNGRLRVQSQNGTCYLSSRVLFKLCENTSPLAAQAKLMDLHPYLSDPTGLLSSLFRPAPSSRIN